MPILHYFGVVGAALIGLLFVADAHLPRPVTREEPVRHYKIRITSERIGPEAVTFSGHAVNFGPVAFAEVAAGASEPEVKPSAVASSFAVSPPAKNIEARPRQEAGPRQRVAKRKAPPPARPIYEAAGPWEVSRERFAHTRHERAFNASIF